MQVKVENHLAPALFHIEQELISRILDPALLCHIPCNQKKMGNNAFILIFQVIDTSDMSFRYYQEMDRCGRVNVPENHTGIIFI